MATKTATTKKRGAKRPARSSKSVSIARTDVRESAFRLPRSVPTQHEGLPLGYEDLVPQQPEE
jgi:hypothetical protein